MPQLDAMMPTSSETDLFPMQLAFCFCLFGFFGTIISTSVFLKWQRKRSEDSHPPPPSPHKPQPQPPHPHPDPMHGHYHHSHSNLNAYAASHLNPKVAAAAPPHVYSATPPHTPPLLPACHETNRSRAYHQSYLLLPHSHYQRSHYNHVCGIHNTQIILDWDDTLFPTAYTLWNMKHGKTNSKYIDDCSWRQLRALTNTVLRLLLMFVQLFGASNVCIVTNAKLSWWNDSCLMYRKLFAHIHELVVNRYDIKVISAYDLYKRRKSSAFMDVLSNKRNISQVICIGDSFDEYEAIDSVCSVLRIAGKRSINYYRFKLLESPSLDAMIHQLESIKQLDYYVISKQRHDQSYTFK